MVPYKMLVVISTGVLISRYDENAISTGIFYVLYGFILIIGRDVVELILEVWYYLSQLYL